jgi:hypothetical protein
LRYDDAGKRLGMLLGQCTDNGDRGHGARQGEGRHDRQLAGAREVDEALQHRHVELKRRVGVDDGPATGV